MPFCYSLFGKLECTSRCGHTLDIFAGCPARDETECACVPHPLSRMHTNSNKDEAKWIETCLPRDDRHAVRRTATLEAFLLVTLHVISMTFSDDDRVGLWYARAKHALSRRPASTALCRALSGHVSRSHGAGRVCSVVCMRVLRDLRRY